MIEFLVWIILLTVLLTLIGYMADMIMCDYMSESSDESGESPDNFEMDYDTDFDFNHDISDHPYHDGIEIGENAINAELTTVHYTPEYNQLPEIITPAEKDYMRINGAVQSLMKRPSSHNYFAHDHSMETIERSR